MKLTKEMIIEIIKSHMKDYQKSIDIAFDREVDEDDVWLQINLSRKQALKSVLMDIEEIESLDDMDPFYDRNLFEVER